MSKVLEVVFEVSEQPINWDRVIAIHEYPGSKDHMIMYLFDKYTYQQMEMTFHRTLNLLLTEYMFEGHFNGNGCLFCEVDTENKFRILFPKEYRRNYKIPYLDKIGVEYNITSEKLVSLNF